MTSAQPTTPSSDHAVTLVLRIDAWRRAFEQAWREDRKPRVEDQIALANERDRKPLLAELLPLELALRRERGESPTLEEYTARFPEYSDLVAMAFQEPTATSTWPNIPGYEVLAELGRGGMGVVYRAKETALGRMVALKVLPQHIGVNPQHARRFAREARAAARLHHTNIVPVFAIGEHRGLPFYAMQLIPGASLDQIIPELRRRRNCLPPASPNSPTSSIARALLQGRFSEPASSPSSSIEPACDEGSTPTAVCVASPTNPEKDRGFSPWPTTEERASLPAFWRGVARIGVQAASALDFAHQHGVLHRDIKPSNLILDRHGTVWLTDFGLAKLEDQEALTETGDVLGTLRYLSPEALLGQSAPAGDVYALGLTLYELLALRPAREKVERRELLWLIQSTDPPRLEKCDPSIPRDLVTVVHKAIEPDAAKRYPSAAELAADLQRFLNNEPILARRLGPGEQLARWAGRNRAVAGLLLAVLLAMVAGTAVSSYFAYVARQRLVAEQAATLLVRAAEADARQAKTLTDLIAARLKLKEAVWQAETGAVDIGLFKLIEALRLAPATAEGASVRRVVCLNFAAWERQLPILRFAARLEPLRRANGPLLADLEGSEAWLRMVGTDGKSFATWSAGRPVLIWDSASGRSIGGGYTLADDESPLTLNEDGSLLLTRRGPRKSASIRLRRLATGEPVGADCALPSGGTARTGSAVRSARLVMTGGTPMSAWSGARRFWDLETGKAHPLQLSDDDYPGFRLFHDLHGKPLAMAVRYRDGARKGLQWQAEFWEVETGRPADLPLQLAGVRDSAIDWQERTILTVYADELSEQSEGDGSVRWWDAATGRLVEHWRPGRNSWCSFLAADGQTLAAWGEDERLRLFELDTGLQRGGDLPLTGGLRTYDRLGGAALGYPVALAHFREGLVRAWGAGRVERQITAASRRRQRPSFPEHPRAKFDYAIAAPGAERVLLGSGGAEDYAPMVDAASGQPVGSPLKQAFLRNCAFSPDGRLVATAPFNYWADAPPLVQLWDARTGQPYLTPMPMPTYIFALAFSPDSRTLAVGRLGGTVLIDVETGATRCVLPEKSVAASLAFSPDGTKLAVGHWHGWTGLGAGVRQWDVATGSPLGEFQASPGDSGRFKVSYVDEARTLLAWDSLGGRLFVYDAATGRLRDPRLPSQPVRRVATRPRDSLIAVAYDSGTVQQWDLSEGRPVAEPMAHPSPVTALIYDPDGRTLAVVAKDHTVRLWDSAMALPIGPPLVHGADVLTAQFTNDGRRLVTAGASGEVRQWLLPEAAPERPEWLDLWASAASGRRSVGEETAFLSPEEWSAACRQLAEQWPEAAANLAERRSASEADSQWHDARAREAAASGNTFALLWHLERLARQQPADGRIQARRGMALAEAGSLGEAEEALLLAEQQGAGSALRDLYAHGAAAARTLGNMALERWFENRSQPRPLP